MIRTKSVSSPVDPLHDGLRLLVTRFRGRGLPADKYDVWMPNLAPSEQLLRAVLDERIAWAEFARRYRAELRDSISEDRRNASIKNHGQKFTLRLLQELARRGPVTLLCHCAEDRQHCHRHLLAKILQRQIT
jgi:uncharacterized protein YeaO (DUF488 family)